jgi:hypothetical protein
MDPDPDPALFVSLVPSKRQQKIIFSNIFAYSFLKVHIHHSSKLKSHKEITKQFFLIRYDTHGRVVLHTSA